MTEEPIDTRIPRQYVVRLWTSEPFGLELTEHNQFGSQAAIRPDVCWPIESDTRVRAEMRKQDPAPWNNFTRGKALFVFWTKPR